MHIFSRFIVARDRRGGRSRSALTAPVGLAVGALVAATAPGAPSAAAAGPTPTLASSTSPSIAAPSHSTERAGRIIGHDVVTLVTGDRVSLTRWSDGRSSASLVPGSPSLGKPVQTVNTSRDTYVIPKMPIAQRARLDASLFDVSRLGKLASHGGIPLVVRFAAGTNAHRLPGIRVDVAGAAKLASGQVVAHASYSSDSTALSTTTASWADVSSVSLPRRWPAQHHGYRLRTLTVKVLDTAGEPIQYAEAWIQNVDDGRLFIAPISVVNGVGKVSVPEGHYSITVGDFEWTVVNPDITVGKDRSVTLDGRDATVRPHISVPRNSLAALDLTLLRTDRTGHGAFSYGIGGVRRLRLSPVPAHLRDGELVTSLGGTFLSKKDLQGGNIATARLVSTKDTRHGIPATIDITHPRSDFAIVRHDYFATGPERPSNLFMFAFTKYDDFAFIFGLPITLGSSRTVWLQGGDARTWLQSIDAFFDFRTFTYADMTAPFQSYSPGVARPLEFLRGPVGPGLERGINADATGNSCLLCRNGNVIHGALPLMSSAGTSMVGYVSGSDIASWRLVAGRRTIQRGTYGIFPHVTVPADSKDYVLTAASHPDLGSWRLSTDVSDTWGFSSASGKAVIPLLIPSYVPTGDIEEAGPSGRQSFRLDFDNLGPQAARVTRAAVEVSVLEHGGWNRASVTRIDANSFQVSYPNPAKPGRPYVNLRVIAMDVRGRTVVETARHAYRSIRPTASRSSLTRVAPAPKSTSPTANRWAGQAEGAIPACGPAKAHQARCFALIEARGREAVTKAGDPNGYNAIDLRDAYGVHGSGTSDQTVAVVVAYDYPSAESDMNKYRRTFGLPTCTTSSGCFTKINQHGNTGNYPEPDQGWALEAALDLQMISAMCPTCHIILAEANDPYNDSLNQATDAAAAAGADVTNHSYGIQEYPGIARSNRHYNHRGVTAVSATGDYGYQPAQFPASSPSVVGAGGTVLRHATNPRGWNERAWAYGGSGCSAFFAKPDFQTDRACGMRTSADLSAVADGVAVYDTFVPRQYRGWLTLAGTSISSPLVAGMIAAAGAGGLKPGDLYSRAGSFHDITRGSNGFCRTSYICTAKPGYDGPTGLGTPRGLATFAQQR